MLYGAGAEGAMAKAWGAKESTYLKRQHGRLSIAEIARNLGFSESTVRRRAAEAGLSQSTPRTTRKRADAVQRKAGTGKAETKAKAAKVAARKKTAKSAPKKAAKTTTRARKKAAAKKPAKRTGKKTPGRAAKKTTAVGGHRRKPLLTVVELPPIQVARKGVRVNKTCPRCLFTDGYTERDKVCRHCGAPL